MAPLIFISAFITHLFGGSAGREGAALQIGGGLSAEIARILKMDERNGNLLVMCGMSGLFRRCSVLLSPQHSSLWRLSA